jgi:hypothetical protein
LDLRRIADSLSSGFGIGLILKRGKMNRHLLNKRLRILAYGLVCLLGLVSLLPGGSFAQSEPVGPGAVHLVEVRGVINPPIANYIRRALDQAAEKEAGDRKSVV